MATAFWRYKSVDIHIYFFEYIFNENNFCPFFIVTWYGLHLYSKIPLLRPPKSKTNSPLKSIFKKFQSFFLCVFCTQCLLERDHLWECSKVVLKTTFEHSQRWSFYRNFTVYVSFFLLCYCTESFSLEKENKKITLRNNSTFANTRMWWVGILEMMGHFWTSHLNEHCNSCMVGNRKSCSNL